MAYLLRVINGKKWTYEAEDFRNLNSIPADPIGDILTTKQTLSFFKVGDYNFIPETIIAGYASNRGALQELQVVIIDEIEFTKAELTLEESLGKTPHMDANQAHRELVNLKAKNLISIAKIIFKYFNRKDRVKEHNNSEIKDIVKII
jgi:hypothetical protein